jgi:mRNA interferase MazF
LAENGNNLKECIPFPSYVSTWEHDEDHTNSVLNSVNIAPITSTIRSIPTEVVLTEADGLPNTCAANFDNLQAVPKSQIGDRIAHLTLRKMQEAAAAVSFALEFELE